MSNSNERGTASFTWLIIVNPQNSFMQVISPFCRETETPYFCPTTGNDRDEGGHLDLELKRKATLDTSHWE